MLKPGLFLASIDIKDAFYSVLTFPGHRKYVRFIWKGNIYQFLAMSNGYINATLIFNKLRKTVFASLHELGYESSVYADDSLLLSQIFEECFDNVLSTESCYKNWVLSYTQQSLYLYQVKKLHFYALKLIP